MKRLICNWKMNLELKEILSYKKELEKLDDNNIIICPSFCYLPIMHSKKYLIGAQDVSEYNDGAYTGQVSAKMLKSLDVKNVLLNHFELKNDLEQVKRKIKRCLEQKLHVYIFISETEEEHYYQYTLVRLLEQIKSYLVGIDYKDFAYISFVYEPIWLIGKETSLTCATIKSLFYLLKKEVKYLFNYNFEFLYGGGLTNEAIKELNSLNVIDGFVLGNCSLDVKNVVKLVKNNIL